MVRRAEPAGYFREPARIDALRKEAQLDVLRPRADFQKLLNFAEKQRSSPSKRG